MENSEQTEETPILYDCREPQKIPLIVPKGSRELRVTHHIKPLSNERYFQFDNEVEEAAFYNRKQLSEMFKPHYDLWRELLIEREGFNQTSSDALIFEAVHVVKALLYFEKLQTTAESTNEPYDDETDISLQFGAMSSGAWLGLQLDFKSEFDGLTDKYLDAMKPKRRWGNESGLLRNRLSIAFFVKSDKAENIYKMSLPFAGRAEGYAETENLSDVVPAWHINQAAVAIHSQAIGFLSESPLINQVQGR